MCKKIIFNSKKELNRVYKHKRDDNGDDDGDEISTTITTTIKRDARKRKKKVENFTLNSNLVGKFA